MAEFGYPVVSGITYADDAGAVVSVELDPADGRVVLISQDGGDGAVVALSPVAARFLSMQLGELVDVIEGGERVPVSGLCSGCGASWAACLDGGFDRRCCEDCNHLSRTGEAGER